MSSGWMKTMRRGLPGLVAAAAGLLLVAGAPTAQAAPLTCATIDGVSGTGGFSYSVTFSAGDVLSWSMTGGSIIITVSATQSSLASSGSFTMAAGTATVAIANHSAGTPITTLHCSAATTTTTTTTTGNTVASNAKQSTQYVAPKVMATATTAIGTLIGNNIKGAFSRVGSLQGRTGNTAFAGGDDPEGLLARATGSAPQANAVGDGLRQGLLDGKLGGFTEMSYSHLRSTEAGGQYSGDVKNGVVGVDYLVRPDMLVGLAGGYEWTNFTTTYNSGWLDGHGVTVAPYFGYTFDRFVLDLTLGHSWLQYDNLRGTSGRAYGSYDAERNFVTSNLTATYYWRTLRLAPTAGLLFAREEAEAYTDSTGARQDGVTTRMGRASLGGEIGHPVNLQDICSCSVEPFIKAKLNYDFLHDGQVILANGQLSAVNDVTGQAGGGFKVTIGRYIVALIDSSYDTLGASNLYGWNVRGRIDFTVPF